MSADPSPEKNFWKNALAPQPGHGVSPIGPCPEPEQLANFRANTGLTDVERTSIGKHLELCPSCMTELELMASFDRGAQNIQEEADAGWIAAQLAQRMKPVLNAETTSTPHTAPVRPQVETRLNWWQSLWQTGMSMRLAGSLAALLVVAGGAYLMNRQDAGTDGPDRYRAVSHITLAAAGDLPEAPASLAWSPVENAATYQLEIQEVDQTILWSHTSTEPSVEVPSEIRAKLLPGKTVTWQVRAYSADKKQIAQSDAAQIRVARIDRR